MAEKKKSENSNHSWKVLHVTDMWIVERSQIRAYWGLAVSGVCPVLHPVLLEIVPRPHVILRHITFTKKHG